MDIKRILLDFPKVTTAAFKAVLEVESSGSGFLNGKPKILVEGHIAYRLLGDRASKLATPAFADVLYPKWTKAHYVGGMGEYKRLEKLKKVAGETIAFQATSWGIGQIMGMNFALCGYDNVQDFVEDMHKDEETQLIAMMRFIKARGLLKHIEGNKPNWAAFAKGYNGSGYLKNQYDTKLAKAFAKYS